MDVPRIDNLQYCNFGSEIFAQLRAGRVDAVHVTVTYHEDFRQMVGNLATWNRYFEQHADVILRGLTAADVRRAQQTGRTAIFFGLQNPSPIGDDIGLVEICHQLGLRFMQLTYNNQSLLGSGCYEQCDTGLTRMGREVVTEMNRVGLAIDLSHAGAQTARAAIDASSRPVAITHANPARWHDVPRNIPDDVLRALTARGGMLGFSLYPHHLAKGSACTLDSFCAMVANTAERFGAAHLGFGSDLCQGQPNTVVNWMRNGRWTKDAPQDAVFPPMPTWFQDNRDWDQIAAGLVKVGFNSAEVDGLMGGNWMHFYEDSFGPQS